MKRITDGDVLNRIHNHVWHGVAYSASMGNYVWSHVGNHVQYHVGVRVSNRVAELVRNRVSERVRERMGQHEAKL
jgi:RNase P protein component